MQMFHLPSQIIPPISHITSPLLSPLLHSLTKQSHSLTLLILRQLLLNGLLVPLIPKRPLFHNLLPVLLPRLPASTRCRRCSFAGEHCIGDVADAGDGGTACDEGDYLGEGWGVGCSFGGGWFLGVGICWWGVLGWE